MAKIPEKFIGINTDYIDSYKKLVEAANRRPSYDEIKKLQMGDIKSIEYICVRDNTIVQDTFQEVIERAAQTAFSEAPFKLVRDYLASLRFLEDYAPNFADYATALFQYRLEYTISQEKINPRSALRHLAQEIEDFCKHNTEASNITCKVFCPDFDDNRHLKINIFGKLIQVHYKPDLPSLDWENRYKELRRRYGQA